MAAMSQIPGSKIACALPCILAFIAVSHAQPQQDLSPWTVGNLVVQFSNDQRTNLAPPDPLTKSIVFNPTDDILVFDRVGARPRKVEDGISPALSPDGGMIAYCGVLPGIQSSQLMLIKTDGTGKKRLTDMGGSPCSPAWSPDGMRIAFTVSSDRGQLVMVLDFRQQTISRIALGSLPRWSPDGKRLVFLRAPETHGAVASIYVADADGKHAKFIVETHAPVPSANWNFDGNSILYTDDDHHRSAIFRANLDGSHVEELADQRNREMYYPAISPDGKQLVVVEQDAGEFSLTLIDLATHKAQWLARGLRGEVRWVRSQ